VELKSIKIRWVGCFLEYPYGLDHKKDKIVLVVPPFSSSVPHPQHLFSWNSPYSIKCSFENKLYKSLIIFIFKIIEDNIANCLCPLYRPIISPSNGLKCDKNKRKNNIKKIAFICSSENLNLYF